MDFPNQASSDTALVSCFWSIVVVNLYNVTPSSLIVLNESFLRLLVLVLMWSDERRLFQELDPRPASAKSISVEDPYRADRR